MKETSKKNKTQKCMKKVCKNYRKTYSMKIIKNTRKRMKKLKEQLRKNKKNMTQKEIDENISEQNLHRLWFVDYYKNGKKYDEELCKNFYCNPTCKNTIHENVNDNGFSKELHPNTVKRMKKIGAISCCNSYPSETSLFS